jgi:outer membrane protein insertion porin family
VNVHKQVSAQGQSRVGVARAMLLFCVLGCLPCGSSAESYEVSGVQVAGNRRIDGNAITQLIKGAKGNVSSEEISKDVKTLYNTGFFDQVTVSYARAVQGGGMLRFAVTEKPLVRKVFVKGNKEVKEDDLSNIIKFDSRRFLDRSKVDLMIRRAISYYQSQGFYDATFEYSVLPVGDNQVDLTFTVNEGTRYRVREVAIRGLKEMDDGDVADKLQVKEYKWWSSWLFGTGRVNAEMLEGDKQVIRQTLLDNGFIDSSVADGMVEKKEDGLHISFDVAEGDQYKIGRIKASGDLVEGNADKTVDGIKSEAGEIFSASKVREDIFTIADKFSDQGFAFANVVPNTDVRREAKEVDLDFAVAKGKLVRVNRINISGNQKTYDNVIRREMRVGEQELYSGTKIKRSQTILERLGYFEEVNITNEPTGDPDKVDLNVNVREGSTGSFSAGAGYSTADRALFNARISENNLFGTGRRGNINLDFGSFRQNQIISLDDPRLFDSYVSAGTDIFRTDRQFIDFDRQMFGVAQTFGYPGEQFLPSWGQDLNFSLKYDFSKVDITRIAEEAAQFVKDSEGETTSSSISPIITRNTINNPMNPTRGSRQVVSVEFAGLGGDQEFYLFEARNTWYQPIIEGTWGELVISNRTWFDYGDSLNDEKFPLFRRFFPGGINSVRGYVQRGLGPQDENGRVFGGNKQFINNFEIIFPLLNSAGVRGILFYDFGNAFDDDDPVKLSEMRKSWGYGIRWMSPLGPIRIEFGYPLNRQPGERGMVPMFSFGAPL